ncbi:MAG: hypothetical protein HUU35_20350 [Armatimonadetes bacterium]|nr:hypothetical protein [Armatimonadota bacterium]
MTRAFLLALSLLAAAVAEPPPAVFGPRVNLVGEAIPLGEAMERIGRQINRRFVGAPLQREQARQTYRFQLENATVADTLRAVEETTGLRIVRRSGRSGYVLTETPPVGQIGRRFGDYRVWVPTLRYSFYSYLAVADPARRYQRSLVNPSFVIEAPSDAEALRIRSIGAPWGMTASGLELPPTNPQAVVQQPSPNDARLWVLDQYIQAPELGVPELARVWFEVVFARSLTELRFDYPLKMTAPQLQTDGEFDAQLDPQPKVNYVQPGLALMLSGPVPAGLDPGNAMPSLARYLAVEGRFYEANDQALYTEMRLESATVVTDRLTTTWRALLDPTDARKVPARLELRCYVPSEEGTAERVEFEYLPMPPRG